MPEIDIKLKSTADNSGFNAAKRASGDLSQSVNTAGESFEKGTAAGRTFSEALRGNASAIVNLGPAIKALGAMLKTNLIGVLVTLGAIAASFAAPLVKGFLGSKAGAEALRAAADAAGKALQGVAETPMEKLNAALAESERYAKSFLAAQNAVLETQNKIADNEDEIAKIRIQNNDKLSDEEKASALSDIDSRSAVRKEALPEKKAQLELQAAYTKQAEARWAKEAAIRELENSGSEESLRKYKQGLEYYARLAEMKGEIAKAAAKQAAFPTKENVDAAQDLVKRYVEMKALAGVLGIGKEEEYTAEGAKKKEEDYKKYKAPVEAAEKAEAKAANEARSALDKVQLEADKRAALAPSEAALRSEKAKQKGTEKQKGDTQAEIDALGKEAEEAAARGDWAAQDAAVAKRRALLSAGRKPSPVTTYAPSTAAEKAGQTPGANEPASSDQLPDLAGPLNEAAQKAGDSATQSAESIQAAAEAAKAVADNTKPLDASGLTTALQAAATAQQSASTQTAAGMQQLVSLGQQQVTIAQQQASEMAKLRSQVENLRQRLNQLAQRAA